MQKRLQCRLMREELRREAQLLPLSFPLRVLGCCLHILADADAMSAMPSCIRVRAHLH